MSTTEQKTDWGNGLMRQAFYHASDGIGSLSMAKHAHKQDKQLAKLITQLEQARNELHDHLNKNYLWD